MGRHGHQVKNRRGASQCQMLLKGQDEVHVVFTGFGTIRTIKDLDKTNLCRMMGQKSY